MLQIHVIMMVLAAWRMVELFEQDTIFNKLRNRWKRHFAGTDYENFLGCYRCTSFWISLFCVGIFATQFISPYLNFVPFLYWPFAISLMVIQLKDLSFYFYLGGQRKIVVLPDIKQVKWGEYGPEIGKKIMAEAFGTVPNVSAQKYVKEEQVM